ncbi:MAG: DRTGG domain-containing protein [Candidatus Hodarchaeales archaeon]
MQKIVVASIHEEAGKTSLIIGLAKALAGKKKVGYMKPFGDRLLYQKKRLWDYDAALITNILDLKENPEDISIGFAHSKLRFMYNESSLKEKLKEICTKVGLEKDLVFIEAGRDLAYGRSVHLDPITMAQTLDAKLLVVLSGQEDVIIDNVMFLKQVVKLDNVDPLGVIINQVKDVGEFKDLYMDLFNEYGINVLGIVPYQEQMQRFTMEYLHQTLFAKVIAGEGGLDNIVHHILVGAMSAAQVVTRPVWTLEHKLVITPGDRSDMILAALETSTAGILLTNNIVPDDPIIQSKADNKNIPILLVSTDTFTTAKQIDKMEILFTKDETDKIALLENLAREHIDLAKLL